MKPEEDEKYDFVIEPSAVNEDWMKEKARKKRQAMPDTEVVKRRLAAATERALAKK